MKTSLYALFISTCILTGSAYAAPVTVAAVDAGWYRNDGSHTLGNTNTSTGWSLGTNKYNSFYNFDLGVLPTGQKLISAVITFRPNGSYNSADNSEKLELWDVTTLPGAGSSLEIYNDLMGGVKYGETTVFRNGFSMPEVKVSLYSAAFADLMQGGLFSIGAHVPTATASNQSLWASSTSSSTFSAATLTLNLEANAVPEPSSLALLGIALGGLMLRARKKAH